MILTTDAAYRGDRAVAAGILHPRWQSDEVAGTIIKKLKAPAPYQSGQFYRRELPCLLSLLDEVEGGLEAIVIDGYVDLGAEGKPGLGRHLFNAMDQTIAVIGVAKRAFRGTPDACRIFRGKSKMPLFVTSVGMPLAEAKSHILAMHGEHRIPTLLKLADQACRQGL